MGGESSGPYAPRSVEGRVDNWAERMDMLPAICGMRIATGQEDGALT